MQAAHYSLEPLANSVRNHPSIAPLILGQLDHRISLYADDVVLFLSHPEESIPPLLELINKFGELSGSTINWDEQIHVSQKQLEPKFC